MTAAGIATSAPRRVVVVGGGMIGLSCAWSLLGHGIEVRVLDRGDAGGGASRGNAGYIAPALTTPLPHPSILRYGLRAFASPSSPVSAPLRADRELFRFLLAMATHCTTAAWNRAMAIYRPLNEQIFAAFDAQQVTGLGITLTDTDVLAGFRTAEEATHLLHELQGVATAGQRVELELLSGEAAREREPHLTPRVTFVVRIAGQRYLTPASYVAALAAKVRERGGKIIAGHDVTSVRRERDRIVVRGAAGEFETDAAILANGSWLATLARPHGVRVNVHAGRGYSFTVPSNGPLSAPVYLPAARVAVTPDGDRVRVTGMMEFTRPDAELDRRKIDSIVRNASPLLGGLGWERRTDEWVGSRPLTPDGLPLIGATRTPGVFVAGGHGMWGVTLGPLTGRLLAEQIATGTTPSEIRELDPCR